MYPLHTYFVLGFQDGTLALYRVSVQPLSPHDKVPPLDQTRSAQVDAIRVGAMKKLHKAAMGGIVAAAFIPGYTSRIVSVGQDGRCRLVDFDGGGKILRT